MIDEAATYKKYGYISSSLSPKNQKRVVVICDKCETTKSIPFANYNNNKYPDLCRSCMSKQVHAENPWSNESRQNMSLKMKKYYVDNPISEEAIKRICAASAEYFADPINRERHSATRQGQDYDAGEWTGFAEEPVYCEKFNKSRREHVRNQYDNRCFTCNKPQSENKPKLGKVRKLSIHHVDVNREQGCNGRGWQLVPLCMECHQGKMHTLLWQARIEYMLKDEQQDHLSDLNVLYEVIE